MDAAEGLVLEYGFSGTTVNAVIQEAGVTKGAFFHHFESKIDLGHALVERYAELDTRHLLRTLARAEGLSRDPLQQVLIFIGLLKEEMGELVEPFPGCLFAAYCYQAQLFDDETIEVARSAIRLWREKLEEKLHDAAALHNLSDDVDLAGLADMLMTIFEGAFVLSKTLGDAALVARQLDHYRRYVELLFAAPLPEEVA